MPALQTRLLDIAYRDYGPAEGRVVLLLHGWPDDPSTWDGVPPKLNDAGFRTLAPTTRGLGETISANTPRTGNTAVLALYAIEMLDAPGIQRFSVAGHDWGANIAEMLAVGWPNRVERIAMLSTPPRLGVLSLPAILARTQWYHWFQQ